jgi:Mrp family chromosome partitioning ATPase
VSDARLTASVSDATVMLVEWRRTPKDIVEQAVGILSQNDTPVAGLVLNKADFRKMGRYGYGYGYGYRYRGYGKYYRAAAKYYQR